MYQICKRKKSNQAIWKTLGGVALVAVGFSVIAMLPDIKRYIKISTM